MLRCHHLSRAAALCAVSAATAAPASVVLHGTRLVYPADAREVSLTVENKGTLPALVQAWLDRGDPASSPEDSDVPIALTPPVFRLEPRQTQSLRFVYQPAPLPADRETLFWLNVLDIPPREGAGEAPHNILQFAVRSRIKVFFRPSGLAGSAREAPGRIQWSITTGAGGAILLRAVNPTPYHVSLIRIAPVIDGVASTVPGTRTLAPGSTETIALPAAGAQPRLTRVDYAFLDDYGASVDGSFTTSRAG